MGDLRPAQQIRRYQLALCFIAPGFVFSDGEIPTVGFFRQFFRERVQIFNVAAADVAGAVFLINPAVQRFAVEERNGI